MKTSLKFLSALLFISNFSFGQEVFKKIDSIIKDSNQKNPNVGISVGYIENNNTYNTS